MDRWAASVGAAIGAALAVAGAGWDALAAGFGGDDRALGAGVGLLVRTALAMAAGAFAARLATRAARRGGGRVTAGVIVVVAAALAASALPRLADGDPARALAWASIVGFVVPAVLLVPWAVRRLRPPRAGP